MKKFRRVARRVLFVFFMILAAIGAGITGAAPIPTRSKERDGDIEVVVDIDVTVPENQAWDDWINQE